MKPTQPILCESTGLPAGANKRAINPMTIRYISADQVAHLLSYASGRQITERIARLPGFPVPVRFPTSSGGIGQPRWREDEIIAWAESLRAAPSTTPSAPAQNRHNIVNC